MLLLLLITSIATSGVSMGWSVMVTPNSARSSSLKVVMVMPGNHVSTSSSSIRSRIRSRSSSVNVTRAIVVEVAARVLAKPVNQRFLAHQHSDVIAMRIGTCMRLPWRLGGTVSSGGARRTDLNRVGFCVDAVDAWLRHTVRDGGCNVCARGGSRRGGRR